MSFKHKHSLGQNFIIDEFLLEDIADESGITKDDLVLEIGPGNGALTRCLCNRSKFVVSVEIDKTLLPLLKDNLKEYENVSIINADFMNLDFQTILTEYKQKLTNKNLNDDFSKIKVVANLPYYITSPIINMLLQNPYVSEMTLMVQKEVAERIVAKPNGKDYGILTLVCNFFADTEMIMIVSKDCFFPKPKVDSAVVHFSKHKEFLNEKNKIDFINGKSSYDEENDKIFKLIKASFAQRRKKLLNSLSNAGYDKNLLATAFSKLKLDENVRAENLSLLDYKNLYNYLNNS
ncbi:MAG: ribosomal RNA small subunit methyltransferase A [Lachnospiraceae bacterium]|nr:ribosomal RNA small subunit methyltransferase A [Lachnospiraceae bacterium]